MSERQDLLGSIAKTVEDYRHGPRPTPDHVDRWVRQFDSAVQVPLLREMDHVLRNTYFSQVRVTNFMKTVIVEEQLAGRDVCTFWRDVHFLDIQSRGSSQTDMLKLFDGVLDERCGFTTHECGRESSVHVYLDDGVFTGNRVLGDLESWVRTEAPDDSIVYIISIVLHHNGQEYAEDRIKAEAEAAGKSVKLRWRAKMLLENRKSRSDVADVLLPAAIPKDPEVEDYVEWLKSLNFPPELRNRGNVGGKGLYRSDQGKHLLEQEFLRAGTRIRTRSPNLGLAFRPLGYMRLHTLGFGSLFVTFRNCPNSAPLALWAGDYPLFPRATNTDTEWMRRSDEP